MPESSRPTRKAADLIKRVTDCETEKKAGFSNQGLPCLPKAVYLAKKMGKGLGGGKVLQR